MSQETYPDSCAFPFKHESILGDTVAPGMTKREYFAVQIMAGFAAHDGEPSWDDEAAEIAVDWADALIDALNVPPKRLTTNTGEAA